MVHVMAQAQDTDYAVNQPLLFVPTLGCILQSVNTFSIICFMMFTNSIVAGNSSCPNGHPPFQKVESEARENLLVYLIILLVFATTTFAQQTNPLDVQIRDINNRPETIRHLTYGAKATVIIMFNHQCTVCPQYIKTINDLNTKFGNQGINFYAVFPDTSTDIETLQIFAVQQKLMIPIIIDRKRELANTLQATQTPQAFVLNTTGNVLYNGRINNMFENLWSKRPKVTTQELANAITATLKNKKVKVKQTEVVGCPIQMVSK